MSWGNLIAILQYDTRWRGKDDMTLTASFNRYGNAQGMFKQMDKTSNNLQIRSLINEGQLHAIVRSSAWNNWRYQYGLKARLAHFKPGSARILETTGLFPKTSSPMSTQTWMNVTGTAHGQVEYGNYDRNLFRLAGRINLCPFYFYSANQTLQPKLRLLFSFDVTFYISKVLYNPSISYFILLYY